MLDDDGSSAAATAAGAVETGEASEAAGVSAERAMEMAAVTRLQALWRGKTVRKHIHSEVLPIVQFSTMIYYASEGEGYTYAGR